MDTVGEIVLFQELAKAQRGVCASNDCEVFACDAKSKVGLAMGSIGKRPVQGLRHPAKGDGNGWFIWCGQYSDAEDFFEPLHAQHLVTKLPSVVQFLALAPGFRFILDDEYLDVWYDATLLAV